MTRRSFAFTLIELLVVVAIIVAMLALLLPAVMKVREAANRMKCSINLYQLGLALHNFENMHGGFPPGEIIGPYLAGGVTTNAEHGLYPSLLPLLEQQALASVYQWDVPWHARENQPGVARPLKILECPSAEGGRMVKGAEYPPLSYGGQAACTDYVPIRELGAALIGSEWIDPADSYAGALAQNRLTPLSDFKDGTANTLLLVERAGQPIIWRSRLRTDKTRGDSAAWAGRNMIVMMGATFDEGVRPGPCAVNCTNDQEVWSVHPGGANVILADGSGRFLKAGMNSRVFVRLVTRAGGEVVAAGGD